MKYKHIFFDLDHTLWDFDANAKETLRHMYHELKLSDRGIHDFDLFHTNYLQHNEKLWDRYRKGFIKQEELRLKRMWLALLDFKIADKLLAKEMSTNFLSLLPTRTILFPDTVEVLQYLTEKGYGLHLITNGFEETQHSKLKHSNLEHFFQHVITSERSHSLKPQPEIFHYAMEKAGAIAADSIMIGDNLEVDIEGALNVGMDAVHVDFINTPPCSIKPTYTIRSLNELKSFL